MVSSMRRLSVAATVVVLLAACADPAPTGPASGGTPTGTSPTRVVDERVAAYEELITYVAELESGFHGPLYIRRAICEEAADPIEPSDGCDDAFTAAEQVVLIDALSTGNRDVSFVNAWEDLGIGQDLSNDEGAIFVWVGPLDAEGDGFWAGAGMWCGGLCGHGGTYVLEDGPDGWTVTGNAPGTGEWIS